jgi:hypothetical protein
VHGINGTADQFGMRLHQRRITWKAAHDMHQQRGEASPLEVTAHRSHGVVAHDGDRSAGVSASGKKLGSTACRLRRISGAEFGGSQCGR